MIFLLITLTALMGFVAYANGWFKKTPPRAPLPSKTSLVKRLIDDTLPNDERLKQLRPENFHRLGVLEALKIWSKALNQQPNFSMIFSYDETISFQEAHQLNIYRMIQELIENSLENEGISKIQLTIRQLGDMLIIAYMDNRKNPQPVMLELANRGSGLGLKYLKHYTGIIGAQLVIPEHSNVFELEIRIPNTQ